MRICTNACCLIVMFGATACKPPIAAVAPDDKSGSATTAGPTHEALDVPVINASRGEDSMGRPQVVWTGTEAVFLYKEDGWMAPFWVGRMDGRGKLLDRRPVAFDRGGSSLYPAWVDGTIATVFNTGLTDHWIQVAPDGTVRAIDQLQEEKDQNIMGTHGAMHASGRFAVTSLYGPFGYGEPLGRQQLELYDPQGRHTNAVPLDCEFIIDIVATDWGYAVACDGSYSPHEPDALTATVLGIREGKIAWTFGGLPSGRERSLVTDGQRVMIVYAPKNNSGFTYPVTTQLLDHDGRPEAAPLTTQSHVPKAQDPMIWTGKEFAAFVDSLLIRYASDGRPLGVWSVEPRCNREFRITGLAWTGAAYLVLGYWGWIECINARNEPITDDDRLYPLPAGLTWDPTTDAIEPPEWLEE